MSNGQVIKIETKYGPFEVHYNEPTKAWAIFGGVQRPINRVEYKSCRIDLSVNANGDWQTNHTSLSRTDGKQVNYDVSAKVSDEVLKVWQETINPEIVKRAGLVNTENDINRVHARMTEVENELSELKDKLAKLMKQRQQFS